MGLNKSEITPNRQCQTWRMVVLCLWLVTALGAAETKTMLFFGDSLTAGYGLDPDEAFPALIQRKLDASGRADQCRRTQRPGPQRSASDRQASVRGSGT